MAFARGVAAYLRHFMRNGLLPWFLDQTALFAAYASADIGPERTRLAMLPPETIALSETAPDLQAAQPGSLFWSVTNSLPDNRVALSRAPFASYLPAVRKAFGWYLPGTDNFFIEALASAKAEENRQIWESQLMEAVLALVKLRRRAVDIGAHVGFWSWNLARRFETVESFEPSTSLRECFKRNVNASNVNLHAAVLGVRDAAAAMNRMPLESDTTRGEPASRVEIVPLDHYDFDRVDFMKIGVEGSALPVLQGARATLLRNRPVVVLGEHDACLRAGAGQEAAVNYLKSLGASLLNAHGEGKFLLAWK
jgi:FkbM family methyltransferase